MPLAEHPYRQIYKALLIFNYLYILLLQFDFVQVKQTPKKYTDFSARLLLISL